MMRLGKTMSKQTPVKVLTWQQYTDLIRPVNDARDLARAGFGDNWTAYTPVSCEQFAAALRKSEAFTDISDQVYDLASGKLIRNVFRGDVHFRFRDSPGLTYIDARAHIPDDWRKAVLHDKRRYGTLIWMGPGALGGIKYPDYAPRGRDAVVELGRLVEDAKIPFVARISCDVQGVIQGNPKLAITYVINRFVECE